MRKFFKFVNARIKTFNIIDIKVVSFCGIFIGLILAKWVNIDIVPLVGFALLFYAWILHRIFGNK